MKALLTIGVFATSLPALTLMMAGCKEFDRAMQMNPAEQNEKSTNEPKNKEVAYFAAGCFWGVEAAFRRVEGVTATEVGYMGGRVGNPSYQQVCTGKTGHAETVKVEFDPEKVSYEQLLDVFWKVHNPTTLNRQGPDVGNQYRSAIFVGNETHYKAAVASRQALAQAGRFAKPIVTEIKKAGPFYPAEEYHQQYLEKQGKASCTITPAALGGQ